MGYINLFLISCVKPGLSTLSMSSPSHCVDLIPVHYSDKLTEAGHSTMGVSGNQSSQSRHALKPGLWAVWLLTQQIPCRYPSGSSLVLLVR